MLKLVSRVPRALAIGLASGVIVGALAWVVWGNDSALLTQLEADRSQLSSASMRVAPAAPAHGWIEPSILHPLFALTVGPGAIAEPVIHVSGIAKTPAHRAALVSVDGKGAEWLGPGDSLGPVTLIDVAGNEALFETPFGRTTVVLGEGGPAASASSSPATPQGTVAAGPRPPPPAAVTTFSR